MNVARESYPRHMTMSRRVLECIESKLENTGQVSILFHPHHSKASVTLGNFSCNLSQLAIFWRHRLHVARHETSSVRLSDVYCNLSRCDGQKQCGGLAL